MILFHGIDDPIIPYLGGESNRSGSKFPVISEWTAVWVGRNGCDDAPDLSFESLVPKSISPSDQKLDEVLLYTYLEGSATFVGGADVSIKDAEAAIKGAEIMASVYAAVTLQNDLEGAENLINQGLISNGPLYSLGYWMTEQIVSAYGEKAAMKT